jgi:hypothetical protein
LQDGQRLCKHTFNTPYKYVWGLAVVSNTQLVTVASAIWSPSKYQLYSLDVNENTLSVQWQGKGDGIGSMSTASPLYDGKYIAVGSFFNVLHLHCVHIVAVGQDRFVEY